MTIGAWIGASVALASLFITIGTLIVNNTKSNTRLACAVENLAKVTEQNCKTNQTEHDEIWETIDEHGKTLSDHETRITVIESKPPRKRTA